MKKRIIAIILSLCLCISLVAALTLSSSAESVTGKDLATLKKELFDPSGTSGYERRLSEHACRNADKI